MSQWLKKQIKDKYFLSTFNAHGQAIRLREWPLGKLVKPLTIIIEMIPLYDCSMKKPNKKSKMNHEGQIIQQMNTQSQSVHSETLLVDATEAFLISID